MSRKLDFASVLAVALTFGFAGFAADNSGAEAQSRQPVVLGPLVEVPPPGDVAEPADPANSVPAADPQTDRSSDTAPLAPAAVTGASLFQLVALQPMAVDMSRDLQCLAGAIYFEAKSESLDGQLAVGRVIVNRARSGRFPSSYCGVVFQQSQFSFVRAKAIPAVNRTSRAWKNAVAIAQIANDGSWSSVAEGALFFHAARVSPRWRLTRIARIDNHVFYR
ncbi:MAG: cell wall hydrolase [Pseudomonadota bacterium]